MKKAKNEQLENAIFTWFLQQRSTGQPISGPILCEKALTSGEKMVKVGSVILDLDMVFGS